MLCQKCGLQPAVVHLETRVFRQKVEEHLCSVCAGPRKPPAEASPAAKKLNRKAWLKSLRGAVPKLDLVQHFLAETREIPPLTPDEEAELLQRFAAAEQAAQDAFFALPNLGTHTLRVAARLLAGKERFARLVDTRRAPSRRAYLATLPALLAATRRRDRAAAMSWKAYRAAASATAKSGAQTRYEEDAAQVRALLPAFHFKLRVYEEYCEELRPTLADIARCLRPFRDLAHSTEKENALRDLPRIQRRLQRHAARHRLAPAELVARIAAAHAHLSDANTARTKLATAYIRVVIKLARKSGRRGRGLLDLIVKGNTKVMRAIDIFTPAAGEAFATHAHRQISVALAKAAK